MADKKPAPDKAPAAQAPFATAAEQLGMDQPQGVPDPRLSQSPGLVVVKDSQVPGLGNGGMISHVEGPGQAPVDPVAAGLDTGYDPGIRHAQRAVTQTGTIGAGNRPSTYAEKPDGSAVQQAAPATMQTTQPQPVQVAARLRQDGQDGEKPEKIPGGDPAKGT